MTTPGVRDLAVAVYLPSMVYSIGRGAIMPVVALSARELGASVGVAGTVVALLGVGQICGDIPAGALTGRLGERNAMLLASGVAVIALAVCLVAPSVWVLMVGILGVGLAQAIWMLARQAYVTEVVPLRLRGRALATLGGVQRIGLFFGPFVGAGVMHFAGTDGAYWVQLGAAVTAGSLLFMAADVARTRRAAAATVGGMSPLTVIRDHASVLRTLGVAALLFGAVRASRQVVIPLWAEHLGLSPTATSLVFGIAGALDMVMFYPAGKVMDRFGRWWVAMPSMLVLGVAHLLLPFTHSVPTLLAASLLMGAGNGIGSGLIMTLGSDVSPPTGRAEFLGIWRLTADTGTAIGPVIISGITVIAALAPAILAMGAIAVVAVLPFRRWIPRNPYGRAGA
ncbi:MAG: MFS transporter [Streptosporangiales bacterium]